MIKAIIFDFDGVIADTFEVTFKSFQEAFKQQGFDFSRDFFLEARKKGAGLYETLRVSAKSPTTKLTEQQTREIIGIKTKAQLNRFNEMPLYPGVRELLEKLHGKYKIAMGTSNTSDLTKPYLEKQGILQYFDVIVSIKDVARTKPSPDIFLKAAEKLKVNRKECVVFEDSFGGVDAAKNAGMKVIAVGTKETSVEELERLNPDLVVKSLTEKEKIIELLRQ